MKVKNINIILLLVLLLVFGCEKVEVTEPGETTPGQPVNVEITSYDDKYIVVEWEKPESGAEYYEIYSNLYDNGELNFVALVDGNVTSYEYRIGIGQTEFVEIYIRSYSNKKFSEFSKTLKVLFNGGVTYRLDEMAAEPQPTILWDYNLPILGFRVYEFQADGSKTLKAELPEDASVYYIENPGAKIHHRYSVVPFDGVSEGDVKKYVDYNYKFISVKLIFEEQLSAQNKMYDCRFLDNDNYLVAADDKVFSFNRNDGSRITYNTSSNSFTTVNTIDVSENKSRFVISNRADNKIGVYTIGKLAPDFTFSKHSANITGLQISSDGTKVYSADTNGAYICWSVLDGHEYFSGDMGKPIADLHLSEINNKLAYAFADGSYKILDADAGTIIASNTTDVLNIIDVELADEKDIIAVKGINKTAIYNYSTKTALIEDEVAGKPYRMGFNGKDLFFNNINADSSKIYNHQWSTIVTTTGYFHDIQGIEIDKENDRVLTCDSEGYINLNFFDNKWVVSVSSENNTQK
ncbi:MAG: hypothetical protein SCALA702_03200 [Melioribacteraceae bacterium]|nr:MAG: hypothetical protein SCALA702_03200 [Melioribacteraceae bacterium]